MLIVCPKCKTKFEADNSIVKNHEKFKCSVCNNVWQPSNEIKNTSDKIQKNKDIENKDINKNEKIDDYNDVKDRKPNFVLSFLKTLAFIIFFFMLILMVIFLSNKEFSQNVIRYFYSITSPHSNLSIMIESNARTRIADDKELISIKGKIKNESKFVSKIPQIVLKLKNNSGNIMKRQFKTLPAETIEAFEEINFEITSEIFSDQITSVEVGFAK